MRKYYLSAFLSWLLLVIAIPESFSQPSNSDLLSKTWRFTQNTSVSGVTATGVALVPAVSQTALQGYEFRIVAINGTNYVIQFIQWKDPANPNNNALHATNFAALFAAHNPIPPANLLYFQISSADFLGRCEERINRKARFIVGTTIMPIKVRFAGKTPPTDVDGNFTSTKVESVFEGNISVGLSAGWKWNFNNGKWGLGLIGGFSLSSVAITPETTNSVVTSNTNASAITIHCGGLLNVDKFQIGIFSGIDYLSGKLNRNWVYKNRPWIGIGMGFSIFTGKSTTETQTTP